jgi:magnesium transporter
MWLVVLLGQCVSRCCSCESTAFGPCRVLEQQHAEKLRQRDERRMERMARHEAKRQRKLEDDPNASEPSSVSNSTFTLTDEDQGWLSSQVEMLLEPYFMSFDSTWNRLQVLGEFIDDTEDYVNITLDSHRNQLIQVDLLLTAATFCVALMTLIAGIFGMNLASGFENSTTVFLLVSVLSCVLATLLLAIFVYVMRQKKLAFV